MQFPPGVRTNLLVKSGRRCCLCCKFCCTKIEVHHIVPKSEGGSDEEDNGIPLCFDCHAEVCSYNDSHPKGTKIRPEELHRHRDRLFRFIEEKGPLVFDAVARGALLVDREALIREDAAPPFVRIDLDHDARVARYLRYIRHAENSQRQCRFEDAICQFEAAFVIAESDATLEDYAQGGNYYLRKVMLWECYLEAAARRNNHEYLRSAFNLVNDENAVREMLILNHSLGELRCRDYFYLLLQQSLFLFDNEFRNRKPLEHSLSRIAQLMDLIENPHCPDREEDFVKRAGEVECEIKEKLPGIAPGACYVRGDV